jgi:hypothetical protein
VRIDGETPVRHWAGQRGLWAWLGPGASADVCNACAPPGERGGPPSRTVIGGGQQTRWDFASEMRTFCGDLSGGHRRTVS